MIDIYKGIQIVLHNWIKPKAGERILFVTDDLHEREARIFSEIAIQSGIVVQTLFLPSICVQEAHVLERIRTEILMADVIIGATHHSFITTGIVSQVVRSGARFLSFPLHTMDKSSVFEREFLTMSTDEAKDLGRDLKQILDRTSMVKICTSLGTEIKLPIEGRMSTIFCGVCDRAGMVTSSSFEVSIAPLENRSSGKLVVDASLGYLGLAQVPIHIDFFEGKVVDMEKHDEGRRLQAYIDSFGDEKMFHIAELGIGLNKKSKCLGTCYIEDESAYGTFHIGMGRNIALGGIQEAKGHFDLVMYAPDMYLDGKLVMSAGKICI